MPSINDPAFLGLAAFAQNPALENPGLPSTPLSLKLPEKSISVGSFTLSVSAETSAAVINASTDPDPTGYFNLNQKSGKTAEKNDDAPALEPPATFDENLAYLVLTGLRLGGKVGGKFTIGGDGTLGLDGSATLEVGACMAFPPGTPVLDAVTGALTQYKTIFDPNDLLALGVWGSGAQILSLGFQGSLALSFTVTASSLAASMATAIKDALNQLGPIGFATDVSAKLTVTFSASDAFRVFAHRASAGSVSFSIKKDVSAATGLTGVAGVELGFDETEVNAFVNAAFEKLADLAPGELPTLLTDPSKKTRVTEVLQKLGLADKLSNGVDTLRQKLADLSDKFLKELTPNLTAQFSYSWKRVTSDSLVAQFTVPDAQLPAFHQDILTLNLPRLMKEGAAAGIIFTRLLGKTTTQVEVGFGFSFGVNDYTFLKSWDSLQEKFVETRQFTPSGEWARQYAFLGKRAYESLWMSRSQTNYVELDASTAAPAVSRPALTDFQLGLMVAFTWKGQAFKDILDAVADHACLITALEPGEILKARQSLLAAGVDPEARGEAVVSLSVDDASFRRLLDVLAGPDYGNRLAPNALARALPFNADYPERADVERRMQAYSRVFVNFLAAEELDVDLISRLCRDYLPSGTVSGNLVSQETISRMNAWTAQGTIAMANGGGVQQAVNRDVPAAFDMLRRATGDFESVLPVCVSNLGILGSQNYGCRVLASLLVLAASLTPGGLSLLSRTVQLTWTENQNRHTVVAKPS